MPVELKIKNISNFGVSFQFNTLKNEKFLWEGCTLRNILNLQPNEEICIKLCAVFCSYGVYDVNKMSIILYENEGKILIKETEFRTEDEETLQMIVIISQ